MKNIEKYIDQHREIFDDSIPDRSIWLSIEKELDTQQKPKIFHLKIWKVAVSVIFILSVGVLIGVQIGPDRNDLDYTLNNNLKELKETENYYGQQVNLKLNDIKDPTSKANVSEDLKQLDEIYTQLKEEIVNSGYNNSDVIIQAMIRNQKTKLDILEKILNKQKQTKNEVISL